MSKLSTRPVFTNPTIQDTDEFWINVDNLDTTFTSQKMTGLQLKSLLTGTPLVENVVFIDQNTPTTGGVTFDPNTPATVDTLYISSTNGSTWIWNGTAYVTYTVPVTASTEFYLQGTTIDAGSNKTSSIYRNGSISATSFNTKKQLTYTGASNSNKWFKVFDYSVANDFDSDSFKVQVNEMGNATGLGNSILLDVILKRQDPNVYLNVNVNSDISSFDLANLDVLYNSTTKKITFYYRITTTYTRTNWLVLNAKSNTSSYITWYDTLIGVSLSGETSDTITTKTISLNKVNGAFTLPSTAPTTGQVLGYSSAGVSDWVANSGVAGSGTNNYVARWTPDGVTLGDSLIQDDGTRLGVGVAPYTGTAPFKMLLDTSGDSAGLVIRQTTISGGYTKYGIQASTTGVDASGGHVGAYAIAIGSAVENVGTESRSSSTGAVLSLGGWFSASGTTTYKHAIKLEDGTEGIGKVLTCMESDGKANWVTPSTPDARVQSVSSSATVTPTSTNDLVIITAQSTGLTLANPTGTFTEGQALMIRIKDNGTARTIAFDTNYRAIGVTLPTTTVISKILYLGIIYNSTDSKWDIVGYNLQA